jgi:hypothetical protein
MSKGAVFRSRLTIIVVSTSSNNDSEWVTKKLGYNYEIIYKRGKENIVVDALSIQFKVDGSLLALSLPSPGWLKKLVGNGWQMVL